MIGLYYDSNGCRSPVCPLPIIKRNGFAVFQRTAPSNDYDPLYRGMARDTFAWPLEVENDVLSKALVNEEWEKWPKYLQKVETLAVVPDWPYILQYAAHCRNLKMDVEVYFLGDDLENFDADLKRANIAPYRAIPMGFDVGEVGSSYLYDDGADTILEELRAKFRQIEQTLKARGIRLKRKLRVNEYGLFHTAAEAQYYAKLRRAAINTGVFDFETEKGTFCEIEDCYIEHVIRCARIEM